MAPNDKARRAAQKRRLERQMERRREREQRRRRFNLIASVVGVVVVVGVVIGLLVATNGDGDSNDDAAASNAPVTSAPASTPTAGSSAPASSSASVAAYPCTWTKSGTAAKTATVPSTTTPPRTGTTNVRVRTNRGNLTFALNRAKAPCAVASFVSLASQKYFDSTPCHRLTTSGIFVLQCGDPSGTGSGGPGYSFADELTGSEQYTTGVLAMANSGPNTNGSQFFIVYKDSQLGPQYTVFGTVSQGLDVVSGVAAKGVSGGGSDGKPAEPVTITKVAVAA